MVNIPRILTVDVTEIKIMQPQMVTTVLLPSLELVPNFLKESNIPTRFWSNTCCGKQPKQKLALASILYSIAAHFHKTSEFVRQCFNIFICHNYLGQQLEKSHSQVIINEPIKLGCLRILSNVCFIHFKYFQRNLQKIKMIQGEKCLQMYLLYLWFYIYSGSQTSSSVPKGSFSTRTMHHCLQSIPKSQNQVILTADIDIFPI